MRWADHGWGKFSLEVIEGRQAAAERLGCWKEQSSRTAPKAEVRGVLLRSPLGKEIVVLCTDCASHLRQLHHAFQLYSGDSDGYLPPYQDRLRRGVPERTGLLVTALAPYTRDTRIWFCPSDPFARTGSTTGDIRHQLTSYRTGLANINPRTPALTMDGPYYPGSNVPYWREPHPSQELTRTSNPRRDASRALPNGSFCCSARSTATSCRCSPVWGFAK